MPRKPSLEKPFTARAFVHSTEIAWVGFALLAPVLDKQAARCPFDFLFFPTHERRSELERAVLDQFSVQATVGTEVDVFEENAPHGGLYVGSRFVGSDGKDGGGLGLAG